MLIKPNSSNLGARIIIVGIGGAGNNAINSMIESNELAGIEFVAVNTDSQALEKSLADNTIHIGKDLTKGLGAGSNPAVGKQAADDSVDYLSEALAGTDMVFVTAGMGGGTGTGASPVVAGIAKNLGALTVGVVTKPFLFEGPKRMDVASRGIDELKAKVDALIVIPNQRILDIVDRNVSFSQAMKKSDEVLLSAVKSISDIITLTGQLNVDFADVKAIMQDAGTALMGMGSSNNKETRAIDAAKMAINSPLLDYSIDGARGVLISIRGSSSLTMAEISEAVEVVRQYVDEEANIKFGVIFDDSLGDTIIVTVLATGFAIDPIDAESQHRKRLEPAPQVQQNTRNTVDMISGMSSNNNNSTRPSTQQNQNNFNNRPQQTAPQSKPSNNSNQNQGNNNDDDLDIPAFIRRRQSR